MQFFPKMFVYYTCCYNYPVFLEIISAIKDLANNNTPIEQKKLARFKI